MLEQLGDGVQWKHSNVTADKIYCMYEADSEELVQEHARRGGYASGGCNS